MPLLIAYYTTFDHPQQNSIGNKFTMPPLTLAAMPREIYGYCTAYSSVDKNTLVT